MSLDPYLLVAHEHQRELQSAARRQALVRLATCCRPSTWRRAVTVVAARRRPSPPCCT
ncbi:MAG: hypothetical protein JWN08_560 [Frankiales bacterium]|nr:hypothetical protein [Frankiales bacterium]